MTRPKDNPCEYAPGTCERVRAYARRAEKNMEIFHPEDTTCEQADPNILAQQHKKRWTALLSCEPTDPRHFESAR